MRWKVRVLRPGSENVDRTTSGETYSRAAALDAAHRDLEALVAHEKVRQEYRLDLDGVPMIVWPGIDRRSEVHARRLDELPAGWPGEISW